MTKNRNQKNGSSILAPWPLTSGASDALAKRVCISGREGYAPRKQYLCFLPIISGLLPSRMTQLDKTNTSIPTVLRQSVLFNPEEKRSLQWAAHGHPRVGQCQILLSISTQFSRVIFACHSVPQNGYDGGPEGTTLVPCLDYIRSR